MQNSFLKNFLFVLAGHFFSISAHAQSPDLSGADSLFKEKRYTQSFEQYQYTFDHQHYTPAMLLKMAFIEEGLNRVAKAIYYLNLYYLATRDETVLRKIEELASKFKLEGHSISETDKLRLLYGEYRTTISMTLVGLSVLVLSLIAFIKKKGNSPIGAFVVLALILTILAIHLNFFKPASSAIIAKSNTYIMTGPSAGASVITVAREGHRVEVLGQKDVWTKIRWNERDAYIKRDDLLPIKL